MIVRLIPHFIRKPVHKAYLQALAKPLETINNSFKAFVAEKRIEAALNSQTMLFEQYLNSNFAKFFSNPSERIQIIHSTAAGLPVFFIQENEIFNPVIYNLSEQYDGGEILSLNFMAESAGALPYAFRLVIPISLQNNTEVIGHIIELVEKYKIGGFGYDIIYV